jgi:hypothetical protein
MFSPLKIQLLSTDYTDSKIADCRLPIANLFSIQNNWQSAIGYQQSAIGNWQSAIFESV